jgi:predicted DNA-binding protein
MAQTEEERRAAIAEVRRLAEARKAPFARYFKDYPDYDHEDPKSRSREALHLCKYAKEILRLIAENDVSMPDSVRDAEGNFIMSSDLVSLSPVLMGPATLVSGSTKVLQLWSESRIKLAYNKLQTNEETAPLIKHSGSGDRRNTLGSVIAAKLRTKEGEEEYRPIAVKFVGALLAKMELLAQEMLTMDVQIRPSDIAGEAPVFVHPPAWHEKQRDLSSLQKDMYNLLPHIRLKGGKVDIDGVLMAGIGELIKGAVQPNEDVYRNITNDQINAMRQVDRLVEWAGTTARKHSAEAGFTDCSRLLKELGEAAKMCIGRRWDDPAIDVFDMRMDELRSKLRTKIQSINSKDNVLRFTSRHFQHVCDLMFEMTVQGNKKISANVIVGMECAHAITDHMSDMVKPLSFRLPENMNEAVSTLASALHEHLTYIVNNGAPDSAREKEYQMARDSLKELSASLGGEFAGVKGTIEEGIKKMDAIASTNWARLDLMSRSALEEDLKKAVDAATTFLDTMPNRGRIA